MAKLTRFVHTSIVSRDWKKLAQFYIDVFGCRRKPPQRDLSGQWLERLTGLKAPRIQGIHLLLPGYEKDGPTLEIFQYSPAGSGRAFRPNTVGLAHIAFAVRNVGQMLRKVKLRGGSAVGENVRTQIDGVGLIDVVYARDPEGNIIELQRWS